MYVAPITLAHILFCNARTLHVSCVWFARTSQPLDLKPHQHTHTQPGTLHVCPVFWLDIQVHLLPHSTVPDASHVEVPGSQCDVYQGAWDSSCA